MKMKRKLKSHALKDWMKNKLLKANLLSNHVWGLSTKRRKVLCGDGYQSIFKTSANLKKTKTGHHR